jgi:hypothetical protein
MPSELQNLISKSTFPCFQLGSDIVTDIRIAPVITWLFLNRSSNMKVSDASTSLLELRSLLRSCQTGWTLGKALQTQSYNMLGRTFEHLKQEHLW